MNFNQTRELANVKARSLTLFANGYKAKDYTIEGCDPLLLVTSPAVNCYIVDVIPQTCTCPYFEKQKTTCKHILGYAKLMLDTEAARLKADADACEMNADTYRNAVEAAGAVYF